MSDTARVAAGDTATVLRGDMSDTARVAAGDTATVLRDNMSDTARVAAGDTADILRGEMRDTTLAVDSLYPGVVQADRFRGHIFPTSAVGNNASTVTPDIDAYSAAGDTAIAQDVTIAAPTGTPVFGQKLMVYLECAGTDRNLTWNAAYTTGLVSPPDSIHANKEAFAGFMYQGTAWRCIAVGETP
jgi:hypothetical protein